MSIPKKIVQTLVHSTQSDYFALFVRLIYSDSERVRLKGHYGKDVAFPDKDQDRGDKELIAPIIAAFSQTNG